LLEFLAAVRGNRSGSNKLNTSAPADAAYRAQELVLRVIQAAG
jgi:hypothetical protein